MPTNGVSHSGFHITVTENAPEFAANPLQLRSVATDNPSIDNYAIHDSSKQSSDG